LVDNHSIDYFKYVYRHEQQQQHPHHDEQEGNDSSDSLLGLGLTLVLRWPKASAKGGQQLCGGSSFRPKQQY
jgi:hypothetical protein